MQQVYFILSFLPAIVTRTINIPMTRHNKLTVVGGNIEHFHQIDGSRTMTDNCLSGLVSVHPRSLLGFLIPSLDFDYNSHAYNQHSLVSGKLLSGRERSGLVMLKFLCAFCALRVTRFSILFWLTFYTLFTISVI